MAKTTQKEMTNKEKAQYILENGFSSKSLSTLERMSKQELDLIIQNERDLEKDEFNKSDQEATKTLIQQFLDFLDAYKKERTGKGVSQPLKTFVVKNTETMNFANAKVSGAIGIALAGLCMLGIAIDSLFGWDKLKEKLKEKAKAKNEAKNQQDNPNHS